MIILHGGWQDGWMLLWAEQSPDELRPEGNGHPAPNEHPYCADHAELVNVLANAVPGFRAEFGRSPSRPPRGCPAGAAALFHPALWWPTPSRSRAKPRLTPLVHTGIYRVSPADAIPIFQACKGQGMLTTGVSIGGDLAYWSQAVRFGGGAGGSAAILAGDNPRRRWRSGHLGAAVHRGRRRATGFG